MTEQQIRLRFKKARELEESARQELKKMGAAQLEKDHGIRIGSVVQHKDDVYCVTAIWSTLDRVEGLTCEVRGHLRSPKGTHSKRERFITAYPGQLIVLEDKGKKA